MAKCGLAVMPFGNSVRRKRRTKHAKTRCFCNPKGIVAFSPRLRGTSYLGLRVRGNFNPSGVVSCLGTRASTPLGLSACRSVAQGSSFLATLGFESESRWDSGFEFPKGINPNPLPPGETTPNFHRALRPTQGD